MTNNNGAARPGAGARPLVGIVSIGDVVKNRMEELQVEHEQSARLHHAGGG